MSNSVNVWPRIGTTVTLTDGTVIGSAGATITPLTDEVSRLLNAASLLSSNPLNPASAATGNILTPALTQTTVELNLSGFGGAGDGIRDNSLPLQNAIDAVKAAGGGTVVIGEGTYLYNKCPLIDSGVSIRGSGRKTILRFGGAGASGYPWNQSIRVETNLGNADVNAGQGSGTPAASFTGAITAGQRTYTTGAHTLAAGDQVLCMFGSDPTDVNEEYTRFWDTVVSTTSTTVTCRVGSPEACTLIGGDTNMIFKPTSIAENIVIENLTLDVYPGSIQDQGINVVNCRNVIIRNIYSNSVAGNTVVLGQCENVLVENVYVQRADRTIHASAGGSFSCYGCRNVKVTNLTTLDADGIDLFIESQCRGVVIENANLHSGYNSTSADPVIFVTGQSTGVKLNNLTINTQVARDLCGVDVGCDVASEDLYVYGPANVFPLALHTGRIGVNGTIYSDKRKWSKTVRMVAGSAGVAPDGFFVAPRGLIAHVRGYASAGLGGGSAALLAHGTTVGLDLAPIFASPGSMVDLGSVGIGNQVNTQVQHDLQLYCGTVAAGNYVTIEVEYFPQVNVADDSKGVLQDTTHHVRTVSLELGASTVTTAAVVPSAGTWKVGDRVFNSAPAVGQPKSWVCTVAGTPGTWVSEGNL